MTSKGSGDEGGGRVDDEGGTAGSGVGEGQVKGPGR